MRNQKKGLASKWAELFEANEQKLIPHSRLQYFYEQPECVPEK